MSFPSFLTILVYSKLKLSQTKGGEKNEINFSTEILSLFGQILYLFLVLKYLKKTHFWAHLLFIALPIVTHSYSHHLPAVNYDFSDFSRVTQS